MSDDTEGCQTKKAGKKQSKGVGAEEEKGGGGGGDAGGGSSDAGVCPGSGDEKDSPRVKYPYSALHL